MNPLPIFADQRNLLKIVSLSTGARAIFALNSSLGRPSSGCLEEVFSHLAHFGLDLACSKREKISNQFSWFIDDLLTTIQVDNLSFDN